MLNNTSYNTSHRYILINKISIYKIYMYFNNNKNKMIEQNNSKPILPIPF
jgi:hypothetical protein